MTTHSIYTRPLKTMILAFLGFALAAGALLALQLEAALGDIFEHSPWVPEIAAALWPPPRTPA